MGFARVSKLEPWTLLLRIVFTALFGYFAYVVINAVVKLQDKKIGTSIKSVTESPILYPSVSACAVQMARLSQPFRIEWAKEQPLNDLFVQIRYTYYPPGSKE